MGGPASSFTDPCGAFGSHLAHLACVPANERALLGDPARPPAIKRSSRLPAIQVPQTCRSRVYRSSR